MGLTFGMDYSTQKSRKSLNYGSIIIIPDPDEDGIHIEGLVLNFFHHHFSSLFNPVVSNLKDFPFISSMKFQSSKLLKNLWKRKKRNRVFLHTKLFINLKMKTNGIKITKLSILKVLERQNTKMFLKFLEKKWLFLI